MKNKLLIVFSVLAILFIATPTYSKNMLSNELSTVIKLYKAGNYSECYTKLNNIVKKDPTNSLAYYYLAITNAQIGKKEEAIENYNKVLSLADKSSNIYRYASKGKVCLETPDKCKDDNQATADEDFIMRGLQYTDAFKGQYEKLKIENMMREMNRNSDVEPQKFKEYKDFSSMNNEQTLTNEEIAMALKTLQKAGFGDILNNNYSLSLLNNASDKASGDITKMYDTTNTNFQLIQALFANSDTLEF